MLPLRWHSQVDLLATQEVAQDAKHDLAHEGAS